MPLITLLDDSTHYRGRDCQRGRAKSILDPWPSLTPEVVRCLGLDSLLDYVKTDQLQGTLDLLVLKTLAARGPLHGYGIATHIQQISDEALRVEEGSLYPALHRIEGAGWIASEWTLSATNRRVKAYRLTPAGRRQLEAEERRWNNLSRAVGKILRFA